MALIRDESYENIKFQMFAMLTLSSTHGDTYPPRPTLHYLLKGSSKSNT